MAMSDVDQKNGIILSAGWAALVGYILLVFTWTDLSIDDGNEELIWTRQKANIILGVNKSVDPCEDIYNNSCELYLRDSVGPFTHANLRANFYIENSEIYKICKEASKTKSISDEIPRLIWRDIDISPSDLGSGDINFSLQNLFRSDCKFYGAIVEVAPVDGVYYLVIDAEEGSDSYVNDIDCIEAWHTFAENIDVDPSYVLFGDKLCDLFNVSKGVECEYINDCRDYVETFFPESLSGYATIDDETRDKLVTLLHESYNSTIPIHFGGGNFNVEDAPTSMAGATTEELRQDRKTRQLKLLGTGYESSWLMPGTEVNAYYIQSTDEVFIGGGLLVEPFYHKSYPFEHILAGLGFVIAHEIGHSFGPRAAKKYGRENSTAVMESLERNLTSMAAHQATGYGSELYADYRGAMAVNDVLRVPTDLFFHHMAQTWCQRHQPWLDDPHPPSYWRVTMAFKAMPKYRQVFNCE